MNEAHEACGSDEWRQAIREVILPWALGETDLGDDVLEVGPGYGATTDVLSQSVPRLTSVEIDDELAAMLVDRFADVPSVQITTKLPENLSQEQLDALTRVIKEAALKGIEIAMTHSVQVLMGSIYDLCTSKLQASHP